MKTIKIMAVLLLVVVVAACSKDDDDSGSASTSAGVLDKKTGLRVTSIDNRRIYYDEEGRVDYIRETNHGKWSFSYNPNTITYSGSYYENDGQVFNVSYNGSGYLSSVNTSFSQQKGEDIYNENRNATFSYDGSSHLTRINLSAKINTLEDGERYNVTSTSSFTFAWQNNLLQQISFSAKIVGNGLTVTGTETWVFSYNNSSYENQYLQWAPSIAQCFVSEDNLDQTLAYIGLLGKGPNMLPSVAERREEYNDRNTHNYSYSQTFRYGFNRDGSISYTTVEGTRHNFTYDYAEIDNKQSGVNRIISSSSFIEEIEFAKSLQSIFGQYKYD